MAKTLKKKAPEKRTPKAPEPRDVSAMAYTCMEPYLCDVVRMGEIAASLFDCSDQGQFVFAVTHLEEMLQELRRRYYARRSIP
jgi:hypothetical protein